MLEPFLMYLVLFSIAKSREIRQGPRAFFFFTGPTFDWKSQRERCWSRGGFRGGRQQIPTARFSGEFSHFRIITSKSVWGIETYRNMMWMYYGMIYLQYILMIFLDAYGCHRYHWLVAPCAMLGSGSVESYRPRQVHGVVKSLDDASHKLCLDTLKKKYFWMTWRSNFLYFFLIDIW